MRTNRRAVSMIFALGLGSLGLACGGSGALTGPSAMSASIEGTVVASSTALKVSVLGSSSATVTDPAGHFSLSSVPAGNATLRFVAPGTDAQLALQLPAEQTLQIRVRVSGSQATLLSASVAPSPGSPSATPTPSASPSPSPSPGHEVDFKGAIDSISGTDLTVAGRLVHTDANTQIKNHGSTIPVSTLQVGQQVEVEGAQQADGSVLAAKISVEDDGGEDVSFSGTIDSISGSDLMVSGRLVHTNASTRIKSHGDSLPFSALQVGETVEVEGTQQPDGSVLATKISVEQDGEGDGQEVSFSGTIESISGSDLTVSGRLVHTSASTRIKSNGDNLPLSALQVGQNVEVEGTQQADGSVLATKISVEDGGQGGGGEGDGD